MSDVNTFIDAIGHDVNAAVAPRVQDLAEQIREKTFADYGPRVSTFASQLVKDIIDEQSGTIRDLRHGRDSGPVPAISARTGR